MAANGWHHHGVGSAAALAAREINNVGGSAWSLGIARSLVSWRSA